MSLTCLEVKEQLGCHTDVEGKKRTINIVRDYRQSASGELVLHATRYTLPDGSTFLPSAGESISYGACSVKSACITRFAKETFISKEGQYVFSLVNVPNGAIDFSRNGSSLDLSATSVAGNVVTYYPEGNNGNDLLQGDAIEIDYVYEDCSESMSDDNDKQTLSLDGNALTISNGNTVFVPEVVDILGTNGINVQSFDLGNNQKIYSISYEIVTTSILPVYYDSASASWLPASSVKGAICASGLMLSGDPLPRRTGRVTFKNHGFPIGYAAWLSEVPGEIVFIPQNPANVVAQVLFFAVDENTIEINVETGFTLGMAYP